MFMNLLQERLAVGKDLKVEQSFEDLEEIFEPDEKFSFDAVIQLQETNWANIFFNTLTSTYLSNVYFWDVEILFPE